MIFPELTHLSLEASNFTYCMVAYMMLTLKHFLNVKILEIPKLKVGYFKKEPSMKVLRKRFMYSDKLLL